MIDKDLFYDLCKKYGVELSDKVEKPMIVIDGKMEELTEDVVKQQFQMTTPEKQK